MIGSIHETYDKMIVSIQNEYVQWRGWPHLFACTECLFVFYL
jgi:hypothetical protein